MLRFGFTRRPRPASRLGDVFDGYYFAGVVCGRSQSYRHDAKLLVTRVLEACLSAKLNFEKPGFFGIFARVFSSLSFSYLLSVTELEEAPDVFDIMVGSLANVFRYPSIIMDHSLQAQLSLLPPPLIEDGFFTRAVILCALYSLSVSQYEDPSADKFAPPRAPKTFNLSLDSLRAVNQILRQARDYSILPELSAIASRFFLRPGHLAKICLFDGPQYFYQDRYGNVYQNTIDRSTVRRCLEPLRVRVIPPKIFFEEKVQKLKSLLKELEAGETPPDEDPETEASIKLHAQSVLDSIQAWETINEELWNFVNENEEADEEVGGTGDGSFLQRVQQLQLQAKIKKRRVRRKSFSHRNPAGLKFWEVHESGDEGPKTLTSEEAEEEQEGREFSVEDDGSRPLEIFGDVESSDRTSAQNREARLPNLTAKPPIETPTPSATEPPLEEDGDVDSLLSALLDEAEKAHQLPPLPTTTDNGIEEELFQMEEGREPGSQNREVEAPAKAVEGPKRRSKRRLSLTPTGEQLIKPDGGVGRPKARAKRKTRGSIAAPQEAETQQETGQSTLHPLPLSIRKEEAPPSGPAEDAQISDSELLKALEEVIGLEDDL